MDFRADEHFAKCLRELCEKEKDYIKEKGEYLYWKYLTERLLRGKSVKEVTEMILNIAEGLSDKLFINGFPIEIFIDEEVAEAEHRTNPYGVIIKSKTRKIIDEKIKITDVAKRYGLEVKGNKCICPFHNDTDPSLSFSDKENIFFCHGCHAKGTIVTFLQRMEALKNGKKGS